MRGAVAGAMAAALAAAAPAGAASPVTTFDGTCTATEVAVTHDPPMSGTLRQTHIDIVGTTGECTGTVTRKGRTYHVVNAPTPVRMTADGLTSCQLSDTKGEGVIYIDNRWEVHYDYEEPRVGPFGNLVYFGKHGGFANDTVHLSQSEDPLAIMQACATPEGIKTVHVDAYVVAHNLAG